MSGTHQSWRDVVARVPGASVIVRAAEKSNENHAKDMAASIAFFGFFSLFPLLLGVVAGASFFIDRDKIEAHLDRMLAGEFPGSADFLRTNIEALTDLRGAAGVASVVGLLWSASKMFGALSRGMNLALGIPKGQPFYVSKLRYFAMTIIVSLVLFLAVGGSIALDAFTQIDLTRFGLDSTVFDSIWSRLTSFAFIFATVLLLYTIVPYKRSPWRELLPGALVAALLFELLKALFVLYLDNARNLEAVYGSLSSIVVLLLWLYFSARVLLFGVEIIEVRKEEPSTHELV